MTDTVSHIPPIAIVGMGCMFAKSARLKDYWRLIHRGEDGLSMVPETHWSPEDYFDPDPKRADHVYCRRGGFIPRVDFDPSEFGIPPANLEATDTSQLLALLTAKAALGDAGYLEGKPFDRDRASVILGATGTQELAIPLGARLGHPHWRRALAAADLPPEKVRQISRDIAASFVPWQENSFPGLLGNVIAGRICNRLDLGGTNCVVDAACASSMSALHLSLMELSTGRSDMVLTGGVDLLNDIFMHMCFSSTHILSPTEDIRPFSRDADGTLLGEGLGMLVLKRLADAERDGDRIYALIRSIGSSSDGKSQSIYAPCTEGQEKALRKAYALASISPDTVEMVEAHGTGTRVGDQVEFQTLARVFTEAGKGRHRCALGSVKSQIGHAKAAAGAAGLIKAILALHHKVLPPTLKAENPDPALDLAESPFYLNHRKRPWLGRAGHPRRAGVSSFGFGGSNFHAVLEEYRPEKPAVSWDGTVDILAFSAGSVAELRSRIQGFLRTLEGDGTLQALAAAAHDARKAFSASADCRLLMAFETVPFDGKAVLGALNEAIGGLESGSDDALNRIPNLHYGTGSTPGKLALLFPGQGSQYPYMGADLICLFPEALAALENANRCFWEIWPEGAGLDALLFPPGAAAEASELAERLRATENAQPAIGAVSLAMWRVLESFDVRPHAACGHSFGELTALCAAGWCDEASFHRLAGRRGKCMAAATDGAEGKTGAMTAVMAPLAELDRKLAETGLDVVLANRNSPGQGVLSGPLEAIALAEDQCRQWGYKTRRLAVSGAFHSPLMAPACDAFESSLSGIDFTPSQIAVYANSDGGAYPRDPGKARQRLRDQLVNPVEFSKNIQRMAEDGIRTFIEVGPRSILTGLCRSILEGTPAHCLSLDSSSGKRNGLLDLAQVLCRLSALGYPVALDRWEEPAGPARPKKMRISLNGANYRSEKPRPTPAPAATAQPLAAGAVEMEPVRAPERRPAKTEIPQHPLPSKGHDPMMSQYNGNRPANIAQALQVAEQGLKSMQTLQMKTAETHQKFLDTQAEAARALREMMGSIQQLTGFAPAGHPVPHETPRVQPVAAPEPPAAPVPAPEPVAPAVPEETAPAASAVPRDLAPPVHTGGGTDSPVAGTLLAVVSKLTGYPEEMLDLDMDIESDLGIDSIKRVEILSTLEESLPGLPAVEPEVMGRLKTLGQIVSYLAEGGGAAQPDNTAVYAAPASPEVHETPRQGAMAEDIRTCLLSTVARLTGYPEEMLGTDMDIESDLGIDSIKRVEILSTLEEALPGLPAVEPELMGRLKTLGQIVSYLSEAPGTKAEAGLSVPEALSEAGPAAASPADIRETPREASGKVPRFIVRPESTPFDPSDSVSPAPLDPSRVIYLTDDGEGGLSAALSEAFTAAGQPATVLSAPELDTVMETNAFPDDACALILLAPPDLLSDNGRAAGDIAFLEKQLLLSSRAGSVLGRKAPALFAAVTRLDGAFGFTGKGLSKPAAAGLCGLVKTAAMEWASVTCRALDVSADFRDAPEAGRRLCAELLDPASREDREVGIRPDGRLTLSLVPAPYSEVDQGAPAITEGDVFIVTGGARGVTAASALALARVAPLTLILLGRSEAPFEEPAWLIPCGSANEMKRAILQNEFSGQAPSPRDLEAAYRRHAANREIIATLNQISAAGARASYYQVDVRSPEEISGVLEAVRSNYGSISGIIHGAGVLEDRLIIEKTAGQAARVLETKIGGLQHLLDATEEDPLRFLILFSSVAARFGNRGQADYAMANEVLNKIASREAARRPDCRVTAINWGPWDGGMVTESLKRAFEKRGIPLIALEAGARCLVRELSETGANAPPEVVLGAAIEDPGAGAAAKAPETPSPRPELSLLFKRDIDMARLPVLASHLLDGVPVVPFALMAEWIGHGAMHGNPGLHLLGFDELRLLKGIRLEKEGKRIRLMAGKARKRGDTFEVDVEIRNGVVDGADVIHSRAKAVLAQGMPEAPVLPADFTSRFGSYDKSVRQVYEEILFHGRDLQGIRRIIGLSEEGMAAEIAAAPEPEKWMADPLRSRWISDPLALDCAFQMACLWCHEKMGAVSLPSYTARYRQFCRAFPESGVTAVLEVTERLPHKMTGDFTFIHARGDVIATLTGYEAIVDRSLYRAFKPDRQPAAG